ncbi:uncharacterized protein LOC126795414 [Argentina anserina]|uniref:uncharacterized protein LOC126795414 n=1 Tax=Argentina anserina TaxID=57926 RepID=UPI0021767955|nr:uncharacterized protein LOC126795414 [Potentilla anserina]
MPTTQTLPNQFPVDKMVKDLFRRLTGGPKTREYNIKSLRAVKRNQKRRKMNYENEVSGVDVIGYQIKSYRKRQAIIRLRGGVELKASFVEFCKKRKAISCFNATRQVSHEFVLAPIFISHNKKKGKTLLFYERYDCLLADWREGNDGWWQQATLEQIRATKYMHDKGFIHTSLNSPSNFAIKDNKLKMLNITSSLQQYRDKHPHTNEENIKRDNLKSLRDLLRSKYQEKKVLTHDDEAFFSLFDHDDIKNYLHFYEELVHKLITHPYAMDYSEYMLSFQRLQLADERGYLKKSLEELMEGQQFSSTKTG